MPHRFDPYASPANMSTNKIRDAVMANTVARLRALGICSAPSVYDPRDALMFVNTRTGRATNFFYFVHGQRRMLNAFTTGDIALNDNFDPAPDGNRVENAVFGAGKVCLERYLWYADPALRTPDNLQHMRDNMGAADAAVLKWGEKLKAPNDPVYALCRERRAEVAAQVADAAHAPADVVAKAYFALHQAVLPVITGTNPKIAKMAIGREAHFRVIDAAWKRMAEPLVFIARRALLLRAPNLAYLFCLLHRYGTTCEVSTNDALWANKMLGPNEAAGPLDHFLHSSLLLRRVAQGVDEDIDRDADLARLMREPKLLGRTSALVAADLCGDPLPADFEAALRATAAVLDASGWTTWFATFVCPGYDAVEPWRAIGEPRPDGVRTPEPSSLLPAYQAALRASTYDDAVEFLQDLAAELDGGAPTYAYARRQPYGGVVAQPY